MKALLKKIAILCGWVILVVLPMAFLSYYITIKVGDKLNSKLVYFNALFFASFGWWYTLMNRASELRKYETALSSVDIEILKNSILAVVKMIWGILYLTLTGIIVDFAAIICDGSCKFINLNFLTIYFFIAICALLFLSKPIKTRIEDAIVLLEKKLSEEKRKQDLIKELRTDLSKFEPDKEFENYNTVIDLTQKK